jgi:hypothetical protein
MDQFTLLKKAPMEHLSKQINAPGSFRQGRMSVEERDTVYKCTILDFSLAHKFGPEVSPRQAFFMQEMGIDGTGSHEKSDLASTKFWIEYPVPFLNFFFDTFPAVGAAVVAAPALAEGDGVNDSDGGASSGTVAHDVHPQLPFLRMPTDTSWSSTSTSMSSLTNSLRWARQVVS